MSYGQRFGAPPPRPAEPYEVFLKLDTGAHAGPVVQMCVSADGRTLVSAGETSVRVWDLPSHRCQRQLLGQVAGETGDLARQGRVLRMALSPDERWLLVLKPWFGPRARGDAGRSTELQVFELATGNLHARVMHPGQWLDLQFSPDGRYIALAGNRREGGKRRAELSLFAARSLLQMGFPQQVPAAVAQASSGPAWALGTVPAAIRYVPGTGLARRPRQAGDEAVLVLASGPPQPGGGHLAWWRHDASGGLRKQHEERIALPTQAQTLAVSAQHVLLASGLLGARAMRGRLLWWAQADDGAAPTVRGEVNLPALCGSLAFSATGQRLLAGLLTDAIDGRGAPAGTQTVQVNAYRCAAGQAPQLCSGYYGHDADVVALAFADEDTALSSGGDNHAIHLWRPTQRVGQCLAALRGVGQKMLAPGITADERVLFGTVPQRLLPPGHPSRQQAFELRHMRLSTDAASALRRHDFESRKWLIDDQDGQVIELRFAEDAYGDAFGQAPDLSLFVGSDDEWVLWTASGYFDASPKGAQRIGYHINRGPRKEALFIPSDRFKGVYRPRIVAAVVRHGSEPRARAAGVPIEPLDIAGQLPPLLEWASSGVQLLDGGRSVRLRWRSESLCPGEPVTRTWLLRNGRFVAQWPLPAPGQGRPRAALAQNHSAELPLLPGMNDFTVLAESARASAVPLSLSLAGPPAPAAPRESSLDRGNLYLLSVGVSDFAAAGTADAAGHAPLRYAHRDAVAVFNAFACSQPQRAGARMRTPARLVNRAFDAVHAQLLVNEQATRGAILEALDGLCEKIQARAAQGRAQRDVLFVFLSGHGVRYVGESTLYFWNHDLRATAMEATGLSMQMLGERITSVAAEVVLVVDACHAAMSGGNVLASLEPEELARRMYGVNERGMYVMNAARSEQRAREDSSAGLGVLTGAMLATLQSRQHLLPQAGAGSGRSARSLSMMRLMSGVEQFLPQVTQRAGTRRQMPVFRVYGDLLPLTIYRV
jgi:uncharacterized caspase-like protein